MYSLTPRLSRRWVPLQVLLALTYMKAACLHVSDSSIATIRVTLSFLLGQVTLIYLSKTYVKLLDRMANRETE